MTAISLLKSGQNDPDQETTSVNTLGGRRLREGDNKITNHHFNYLPTGALGTVGANGSTGINGTPEAKCLESMVGIKSHWCNRSRWEIL